MLFVMFVAVLYQIDYQKSKDAAPGTPLANKWYFGKIFRYIVLISLSVIDVALGIVMIAMISYLESPAMVTARAQAKEQGIEGRLEQEVLNYATA